jgi:hypothetical protein
VGAVKFVRSILATKDDFYHRHIVKLDLLKPLLGALVGSAKKDNLISSAISELVEYVRTESIRLLAEYIVEKHSHCFQGAHRELLDRLVIRYEQGKDRERDLKTNSYDGEEGILTGISKENRVSNGSVFSRQAGLGRSRRVSALSDNNREKENEDVYFNTSDDDDDDNNSTDSNSSSGSVKSDAGGGFPGGGGFGDYERFIREGERGSERGFNDYGRDRDLMLERHPGYSSNDPDIDDKIAHSLPSSSSSMLLSSLPYQQQWPDNRDKDEGALTLTDSGDHMADMFDDATASGGKN